MSSLPSVNGKVDERYMELMKKNYWQKKMDQSINLSGFQRILQQTERTNLSQKRPVQEAGHLEVTLNRYLRENPTSSKDFGNKSTKQRGRGEKEKMKTSEFNIYILEKKRAIEKKSAEQS